MERFRLALVTVALLIWSAASVDAFITQNFTPLAITTSFMTVLVGVLFGVQARRNGNGG